LIALTAAPSPVAAQTPIHEYRFDANGNDSAGYAHGVVGGEVGFTGGGVPAGLGQAAVFGTGSPYDAGDAIEIDNALFTGFGAGDFSIATWVRRTSTSGRGDIIDANGYAGDGPGFQLAITSVANQVRLRIDDENGFVRPDSVGLIDDTQWHHIVITVDRDDSQGFKYYIDGVLDSEHDPTSVPGNINPHQDLRFGSINEAGSFAGEIALFQTFDSALSQDEVDRLFCGAGDDCDGDGIADACELQEVTIGFGDQPIGSLAAYSHLGYDISPFDAGAMVVNAGNPAPGFGTTMFGVGTLSIVATDGELFEFVRSDYQLAWQYVRFEGYVNGTQTQSQSAPFGSGTMISTFVAPIDELRVTLSPEFPADAVADNIVLRRVDDCNTNGVPDACETDCNGNGTADDCESLPDGDLDGVPDVCDSCLFGNDALDSDSDGVPNACDVCPGGDDSLDTDGDGIANGCDACAGGVGSGDSDGDGNIQWNDHARLAACLAGPGGKLGDGCVCFDVDDDGDVDLDDVRDFEARFAPARGCYIEGRYYAPLERNAFPNNCEECRPNLSVTSWSLVRQGRACRAGSGDTCDPTEVCTGTSPECPPDTVRPATFVCRAGSGDACDPDEYCTGVVGERCPPNKVAAPTTMCRAADGVCDVDDFCSGVLREACQDAVLPTTTECRASAGVCDTADFCDGVNPDCPADAMASTSTVCQDNSGTCTADKTCDGVNPDCPSGSTSRAVGSFCDTNNSCSGAGVCGDQSGSINCVCPGLTRCWPRQGDCDADDFYDENGECPVDTVYGTSHVCKDNTGTCAEDIKCDGTNKDCPGTVQNKFAGTACVNAYCPDEGVCASSTTGDGCVCPGVTVCRGAAGVCDQVEYYNANGGCPQDALYNSNVACRREWDPFNVSDGLCDPVEYCDGQSVDCPADVKSNVGDVCRASGECEAEYLCYGKCATNPDGGPGPFAPLCLSNADCAAGQVCMAPLYLPLECKKSGSTPADGTSCNGGHDQCQNGECASLIVSEGGQCDGDDWFFIGDVNGFHCDTDAADDLFCCKNGRIAKDGQSGTCRKCCGNNGEDNGGCPQNSTRSKYCCSGQCVDIDSDLANCGSCGNDCQAIADSNPCWSNPQCGATNNGIVTPGACFFDHPCNNITEYCYNECSACWIYGTCDTCTESAECIEFEFLAQAASCEACWSDGDCSGGEVCWSGCGGGSFADLTFCLNAGYCATESSDCGN